MTIDVAALADLEREEIEEQVYDQVVKKYGEKEAMLGPDGEAILRETERMVMLNVIDNQWKDHLLSMDHLKEGIGLRGYGQKDPLVEYKKESFQMFQDMMDRIEDETVRFLFFMQPYEEHRRGSELPYPEIEEWDEEDATTQTHDGASNGTGDHHAAQSASRISRATFSGRRRRNSPTCSWSVVTGRALKSSPWLKVRKLEETIHVHVEVAKSTKSVTASQHRPVVNRKLMGCGSARPDRSV